MVLHDESTVVEVDSLSKSYDEVCALDDVSLSIRSNEVTGILGPNGAGKTTLIKMILGLVTPDEGGVSICGVDVHETPEEAYKHVDATLEGARNVYWRLTVRENLEYFSGLGGVHPRKMEHRYADILEELDLTDKADTPLNKLSRGMKGKVSLATTLVRNVDVIFLDEPSLGFDIQASIDLRQMITNLAEQKDITFVICSHDMDFIEDLCDRVLVMDDGEIIADNTTDGLKRVFQTNTYTITLDANLSEDDLASIRSECVVAERNELGPKLQITVDDNTTIYDVIGVLESSGYGIHDIQSTNSNLEQAFIHLTKKENGTSTSLS